MILTPFQIKAQNGTDESIAVSYYDSTIPYTNEYSQWTKITAALIFFFSAGVIPITVIITLNRARRIKKLENQDVAIKYSYFYREYKANW